MFYRNPKTIANLKDLTLDLHAYAQSLLDENKDKLDYCEFSIVTDEDGTPDKIRKLLYFSYGVTDTRARIQKDVDPKAATCRDRSATYNESPIIQIQSKVYISENTILGFVVDYEFDFDRIKSLFHFVIRHEIGHCIDHARFVGKPFGDFKDYRQKISLNCVPSGYSMESELSSYLSYHNQPIEKTANDAVGITTKDIENFVRILAGDFYE